MTGVAGGGQEILIAVSFLLVEISLDDIIDDTAGCVQKWH